VLPLQFPEGVDARRLGLDGSEIISLTGLADSLVPGRKVSLRIDRADGRTETTELLLRLDNGMEIEYYRHGGILHKVLRQRLQ
jgi:aconitate hydratase